MDRIMRRKGTVKAACLVGLVLALTGALALLATEKTERGFLGVSVQRLSDDEREELGVKHGVQVAAVEKESAAAKAGVLKGDVILSVNGEKVRDPQALIDIVRELPPGSAAKIGLWRGGKALEVKAVLGKYERPKRFHWSVGPLGKLLRFGPYLGVNIMNLDDADLASYFSVAAGQGVLVTKVEKDTPAAKAGLKAGDVIVQVGEKAIQKSSDIHEALADLKKGDSVAVTVTRRGKKETLKAEPDYNRQRRVMRFFGGDKDIAIEHLELPEMNIEIPDMDIDVPEPPPDVDEIVSHVHERLDRVNERLQHAHEKLDRAKRQMDKRLKRISENSWI